MDELINIVDTHGVLTEKTVLKSIAHTQGIPHACIHVWLYTNKGEILLQQRNHTKETFPNYWDVSVAGHISAGENPIDTCLRETEEEINYQINPMQLNFIDVFENITHHKNNIIDHEFYYVYITPLNVAITSLNLQTEEVANVKLVTLKDFEQFLINNLVVPRPKNYYKKIAEKIKEAVI